MRRPPSRKAIALGVVGCALALASCAGRSEPEPPSVPPTTAESPPDRPPEAEPAPAVAADPPAEPAPAVTLTQEVSRFGHVSVSVTNRSEGPSHVALGLALERADDAGAFVAAEDLGRFDLVGIGDGGCAELLPGAELREVWACLRGDRRGESRGACTLATAGQYRFVATSCDGRSRTEGAAFAYP